MEFIQINIISHNTERFEFTSRSLDEIKKIKNKGSIKINICYTNESDSNLWELKCNELRESGINAEKNCINWNGPEGNNYMNKINSFISSDCEYSCSMDDDILLSCYLWDYIIENISILDNPDNLFITPLISNGIPSTDLFIEDFFEKENREEIRSIFKNTHIPNLWGANYESLNYEKEEWGLDFYEKVGNLSHYYKGIHPARISIEAHKKMAELICENPTKLLSKNEYHTDIRKFPYFCNSFYFIKTQTWRKIIEDKSLFRDSFDEVPLNLYMQYNDLNMVFVRNGFCLHMAYNTINTPDKSYQKEIEEYYKINLIGKI
jgi:hypothetical protein